MIKIQRALISVYDKTGVVEFARALVAQGVEVISTGGTLKLLSKEGVKATAIDDVTGFPEIMDGRLKTLHPLVHGGLLAVRDSEKHIQQMKENNIKPIDLVAVNLYPFEETVKKKTVPLAEAIEQIDIGGPTMLRSAAKNYRYVTVVSDVQDYGRVLDEMQKYQGSVSDETRFMLAQKVFALTCEYDYAIQSFLATRIKKELDILPDTLMQCYEKKADLRYGENPHQQAAFYVPKETKHTNMFVQYHGKELSFNNYADMYAAVGIVREFDNTAVCVVKHNNPCGICENEDINKAIIGAIECDLLSAFGGIVALNRECTEAAARTILKKLGFFEIVIAPKFSKGAVEIFKQRKNLRVIKVDQAVLCGQDRNRRDIKYFRNGLLCQKEDLSLKHSAKKIAKQLKLATKKKVSEKDIDELMFAWRCAKVVKSNAIVVTKNKRTIGIGAGQMSRVGAMEIACRQAGAKAKGAYIASDAFFPMPDNIDVAAEYGIKAIIQPGGSVKDPVVIAAADDQKIAMVFTGTRHFKH